MCSSVTQTIASYVVGVGLATMSFKCGLGMAPTSALMRLHCAMKARSESGLASRSPLASSSASTAAWKAFSRLGDVQPSSARASAPASSPTSRLTIGPRVAATSCHRSTSSAGGSTFARSVLLMERNLCLVRSSGSKVLRSYLPRGTK